MRWRTSQKLKRSPERQFLILIAEKLGRTVAELEAVLSVEEFYEWATWIEIQSEKRKAMGNG